MNTCPYGMSARLGAVAHDAMTWLGFNLHIEDVS